MREMLLLVLYLMNATAYIIVEEKGSLTESIEETCDFTTTTGVNSCPNGILIY
jgi:hypothetical protein